MQEKKTISITIHKEDIDNGIPNPWGRDYHEGKVIKITITQADINHGVRRSCTMCPLSRAILRELGAISASVAEEAFVRFKNYTKYYQLSTGASNFINRYDEGFSISPQTVTITEIDRIPDDQNRALAILFPKGD